jgi:hypothetical protein
MQPTIDQLAGAIYRISDEEPLETEIPQAVLDKLAEFGMVHLEVDSARHSLNMVSALTSRWKLATTYPNSTTTAKSDRPSATLSDDGPATCRAGCQMELAY